jgi:diaminopimelate epimerase
MKFEIVICHGSGNFFFLLDEDLHKEQIFNKRFHSSLSVFLCNNVKYKCDGVLFYKALSGDIDAQMDMFNPDGSAALMCGNGLRCVARYAAEKLKKDVLKIKTNKAIHECYRANDIYPYIQTYAVSITPIVLSAKEVPIVYNDKTFIQQPLKEIDEELLFSAIAVPNPHLISIVDDIDDKKLEKIGQFVNNDHPMFPVGINYSFLKVISDNEIFVATYERGVGRTLSCGTAMSACSFIYAYLKKNSTYENIIVKNAGGMVECECFLSPTYKIMLSGNASFYQKKSLVIDMGLNKIATLNETIYQDEIDNYDNFVKSL